MFVYYFIILLEKLSFGRCKNLFLKIRNNKAVFSNLLGLTLFNALGGFLIIVTQVKLANHLGPAPYGLYSYCLAIGEVGCVIVRYGRNKTMLRDLVQRPEKSNALISSTFCSGIINLLIFFILVISLYRVLDYPLTLGCILLITAPCLISLDFQPVYESIMAMSWQSIYNLIQKILFVSLIWIAIFTKFDLSIEFLGYITFFSWIVVIAGQYVEITKLYSIKLYRDCNIEELKSLYRSNFVIALSTVFGASFGSIIRIILNNYSDSTSVGVFSAALQLMLISQFILNQIARVGNPMMSEIGKVGYSIVEKKKFVKRYLMVMIFCTIPFFFPLFFFPKLLTQFFFTDEYMEISQLLPLLAIYLLALSIGVVFTQFLISIRKDRLYFLVYIFSGMVSLITALLIIPKYGVFGAIISLCIPNSLGCIGYWLLSKKYLYVNE